MTTSFVQQTFRLKPISKLGQISAAFIKRVPRMSGVGSNPLNGSLPPDWNRFPSMNTYQHQFYNYNPFASGTKRPGNAFGYYNPNQQHSYPNNQQQQYALPATYYWNNQMQYQQNSLYQPEQPLLSNPYGVQPRNYMEFVGSPLPSFQIPTYPSLSDRLTMLENQVASNFGQGNCNNNLGQPETGNSFGSALNSFVQDMMYVSPPLATLPSLPVLPPPPITTLYQSNLLKELNLPNNNSQITTIPELTEPLEHSEQFNLNRILTAPEKELLNIGHNKLEEFKLEDSVSRHECAPARLNRQWQIIRPPSNSDRSFHFSILNYNVLAQDLLDMHPELYYRHNGEALSWDVRWKNLREEFRKYNCDIVCLQEVQESHKELFDVHFKTLGYGNLYKKRTGDKTDGCAVYYRENMFKLLEWISVEYNQPRISLLDRDNVAIIAKFLAKGNQQEIIVANTHLLFNPRRQDIRLSQTQLFLAEIDRMAFKPDIDRNLCEYHPVIVVGDFNSTPDSSVIEFLKTGYLNYEHLNKRTLARDNISSPTGKVLIPSFLKITDCCQHDNADVVRDKRLSREEQIAKLPLFHSEFKKQQPYSPGNDDQMKPFSTGTLQHKFHFQSVYNHGSFENPEGTTNQGEWITTDYIFFNRSSGVRGKDWKLNLISKFKLPTQQELHNVAIPNYELGSDHLCLVARFSLKTPRKEGSQ